MSKSKDVAAAPAKRALSGAALAAANRKAAKAAVPAHEVVRLSGDFETHDGGSRVFRAGVHSLPQHLVAEARAKGLVAAETE